MDRWGRFIESCSAHRGGVRIVGNILRHDDRSRKLVMKLNRKTIAVLLGGLLAQAVMTVSAQQPAVSPPPQKPTSEVAQASGQPVLRTIRLPAVQLEYVANTLGVKYGHLRGVNIAADTGRGHLVVLAPQQLQLQINNEIQQMTSSGVIVQAGRTVSTAPVSRQFPLKNITWSQFEDSFRALAGQTVVTTTHRNGEMVAFELDEDPIGRATVQVDRRSNAVTVLAAEPTIAGWQSIVDSIDMQNVTPGQVLQLARIQHAEPAPIQRAISLLRQLRASDAPGGGDTIGVVGNDVRFMGAALTAQDGGAPQPPVNPQGAGDAAGGEGDEGGLFGDVQIQFVPQLGIIIVRGAARDVRRVMNVIKEIEAAAVVTQPKVEVVQLKHVDNEALANLVRTLYTEVLNERGSSLSVTALGKPNALLLIGREEAILAAKELIDKLDVPVIPATQLRVFRLEHASALDAENAVRNFFTNLPTGGEREEVEAEDLRQQLGTRVRVIGDYRTNSLIVQAAPRDMQEVARFISDLDVSQVPIQHELRVFPLKNALAEDLQPVLQEAISGAGENVQANENFTQPSTTLSILALDADGGGVIDSGLLQGVVVSADANANALVVRAPSNSMPLIAELIKQLDQLPGAEAVVKVFQLENSDAGSITLALQQLFSGQQQQGGGFGGAQNALNIPIGTASTENSLVQLRFSADARTNSVIAVGAISDLEVVESILLRLDTEGFSARTTEVIWLRNASAAAVATAITEYVTARQQGLNILRQQQTGQNVGSAVAVPDLIDRDLIVVPEIETNMLLLSVSPRFYDTVRRLIDQLDRRPPMVMVKAVIAEVQLDDGFEWGVELGLQDSLLFDRGIAGAGAAANPGFNFNNNGTPNQNTLNRENVGGQGLSTFGLGRLSDQFGYGGFVLAAANESVSVLLRSLQDAGRLQILSRPMIMTRDGTEALIQVGQTVPIPTQVTGTGGIAGVQIGVTPEDVGLILRVIPRVGSDGFIRIEIDAERSAVDLATGVPIATDALGNPIISPIINRTRAQSVIQAFSGQTVVYGGLIQKQRSQFSRRVPYLSNIPYLGMLFRYDREVEIRNELLVIMTPTLVSGEEDLEYIKQEESSRMSYCLADIVEMHGDVGLSGGYGLWGPAVGPVIYPDAAPMIDDIQYIYQNEGLPGDGSEGGPAVYRTGPSGQPLELQQPQVPSPAPGMVPGMAPGMAPAPMEIITPVPGSIDSSVPGLIEPAYPVTPTGHVQQAQHSTTPNATRRPQRIPAVRK